MRSRLGFWTVLGVVIAALGVISPIIWDSYKSKSAIELQHLSTLALLDPKYKLEKLTIQYKGKPIQNITKINFALVNTGRVPIQRKDVIAPPIITFPQGVVLLDFQKERVRPQNLDFEHTIDHLKRTITIKFTLLNPGDSIQFSVLLTGQTANYQASARIVAVKELTVVDRRGELSQERRAIPWTVYPVGFFTLLFLAFAFFVKIPATIEGIRMKDKLRNGRLDFPGLQIPDKYLDFINTNFAYKLSDELERIRRYVVELPKNTPLSPDNQREFEKQLSELIENESTNIMTLIFSLVVAAFGIKYLLGVFL